ncbi:MAG: biopolymer transporter ExbD [Planctomycetota bacterium]|nr:biopolymer transporter ExbD [Planctomycetota bacterium]
MPRINAELPPAAAGGFTSMIDVVFLLPAAAVYRVNNRAPIGLPRLRAEVAAAACDPDVPVAVDSDPRVRYQWVLAALDQCAAVGLHHLRFTSPAKR